MGFDEDRSANLRCVVVMPLLARALLESTLKEMGYVPTKLDAKGN